MSDVDLESVVSELEVEEIAAEAHSHVRTVERRLLGLKVKGRVAQRVDSAIASRGLRVRCDRAPVTHHSEPPRAA